MEDEKKRKTLSDHEAGATKQQEAEDFARNLQFALLRSSQPRPKITAAKAAWGFCLWFAYFLAVVGVTGYVIADLAGNLGLDATFQQGVSAVMIAVMVSFAVRASQIGGRR